MFQNLLPKNLPSLPSKAYFQKELNLITEATKDNIPVNSVESLNNKLLFLTIVISSGLLSITFLNYQFANSREETQKLVSSINSRYENLSINIKNLPETNDRFKKYVMIKNSKTRTLFVFEFLDKLSTNVQNEELVKVEVIPEKLNDAYTGKNYVTFIYNSSNPSIFELLNQTLKNEVSFKNIQTDKILIENENFQYVIKGELYER